MKVFLTSRAFLILSFLWLFSIPAYAFFQNATARVKTKYEFTDTRISEADTLLKKRQYQKALDAYQKAYDTYEAESFYEGMVYAKERMGRTYRSLGEDSLSKITYQAAASLSREKLGPNHILESKAYLNNGIRSYRNGEYEDSNVLIDQSHKVYYNSLNGDSSLFKTIIDFKFYSYFFSYQSLDTAIKYLNERGRYYASAGSEISEEIYLLSDYSRVFFQMGDFQKGVTYALEAVRLSEKNAESVRGSIYSDALFNLTRSLIRLREYGRALSVSQKLIDFTLSNDIKSAGLPGFYNLKAVSLNGLEDYADAANEFKKIISELEKRGDFSAFYRNTIMNLGVCYQLMGDFERAELYLKQSLEKELENGTVLGRSLTEKYMYLGQLYGDLQDHDLAALYYDSAMRCSIDFYDFAVLEFPEDKFLGTYQNLDIAKNKLRNLEKSNEENKRTDFGVLNAVIQYAELTSRFLLENREELEASEGKLFLSEDFRGLYESAINAAYLMFRSDERREEHFNKALMFSGLSKSLLLLEQSGELGSIQDSRLPLKTKNRYYKIKKDIELLEEVFLDLADEVATNDSVRVLNSKLIKLNTELESFKDSINDYLKGTSKEAIFSQSDAEELVRKSSSKIGRGIIDYFVGEEFIYCLAFAGDKLSFERVPVSEEFEVALNSVISIVSNPPDLDNYNHSFQEFKENSSFIYEALLEEVITSLGPNVHEITIVPDQILSRLPFEALVNKASNGSNFFSLGYLVKDYTINYSLAIKSLLRDETPKRAEEELFAVGFSGTGGSNVRSGYGALPGTEEEIKFLKSRVDGDFFLGAEGSKENFMNNARNYDVLHLAVHGEADSTNRYQSRLIFNGESGVLRTSDLYISDLRARLAILSACESGLGLINKGEGTFSIARGFTLVGVPSVVMSLWKVNDKVASDLMVDLHERLQSGIPVDEALTLVKRDYLTQADKYTGHPYYWSAFVSVGEEVSLSGNNNYWYTFMGVAVLLLLILSWYFVSTKKRKGAI